MTKKQILVVEDNGIIAKDIKMCLENIGFSVPAILSTGEESVKKVKKLKPDLILMDIMLKGAMDGIEAAELIRSQFNIPVVYLTAYADQEMLKRAKPTEPFGYIVKPFDTRELYAVIETTLYKHKSEMMLKKAHDELEQRVAGRTAELKAANKQLKKIIESCKLAQKALSESEERFRTIFENAAEGILVTDSKTKKFKLANPAICNMLGYTEKELYQMDVTALHPEEVLEHVLSEFESHSKGEKTYSKEIPCLKKDGTVIYADITGAIAYINGQKTNIRFFTDITEKKKIEKQLVRADRMASLGRLTSGIAHEFRNPLAGINLYVDILKDKSQFKPSPKEEEILNDIKHNIGRIDKIIRRAVAFAEPSAGIFEKADINALIHEQVDLWSEAFKTAKLRLRLRLDGDIPPIFANSAELHQVIKDLFQNATDAMEEGGVLNITTNKGTSKFHKNRSIVIIKVKDTGSGIKPEHKEKVFNPFFTTKTGSTGLGLSISYRIVEQHGGFITCDSEPGKGTTFTIELPLNNS